MLRNSYLISIFTVCGIFLLVIIWNQSQISVWNQLLRHSFFYRHRSGHTYPSETKSAEISRTDLRILCLIVHHPKNNDRAQAVIATWAKRCTEYFFVSTQNRTDSPTIIVNGTESRNLLWTKIQYLIRYSYRRRNDFDWFLKSDDDTYVVLENLRYFLRNYSTESPVYFGTEFKPVLSMHPPSGFISGGAGYVLSRKSISLLVEKGFDTGVCDLKEEEVEEVRLEQCAVKVGVHHDGNTIDSLGRARFLPYSPEKHMTPGNEDLGGWLKYSLGRHYNCCSSSAISFHYITPINMYVLEYFIYILRPQPFFQRQQ